MGMVPSPAPHGAPLSISLAASRAAVAALAAALAAALFDAVLPRPPPFARRLCGFDQQRDGNRDRTVLCGNAPPHGDVPVLSGRRQSHQWILPKVLGVPAQLPVRRSAGRPGGLRGVGYVVPRVPHHHGQPRRGCAVAQIRFARPALLRAGQAERARAVSGPRAARDGHGALSRGGDHRRCQDGRRSHHGALHAPGSVRPRPRCGDQERGGPQPLRGLARAFEHHDGGGERCDAGPGARAYRRVQVHPQPQGGHCPCDRSQSERPGIRYRLHPCPGGSANGEHHGRRRSLGETERGCVWVRGIFTCEDEPLFAQLG
mmetsp:Transcript_72112/g.204721  ORF Transcript_72112/g.204721 Transcript_72112/m.204721 type:complete len:316 (-) Transcript_72112:330-1277(-)